MKMSIQIKVTREEKKKGFKEGNYRLFEYCNQKLQNIKTEKKDYLSIFPG